MLGARTSKGVHFGPGLCWNWPCTTVDANQTRLWGSHFKWRQRWPKKLNEMGIGNSHFTEKQNRRRKWTKANHAPSFRRFAILTEEWKMKWPQILQGQAHHQMVKLQVSDPHGIYFTNAVMLSFLRYLKKIIVTVDDTKWSFLLSF